MVRNFAVASGGGVTPAARGRRDPRQREDEGARWADGCSRRSIPVRGWGEVIGISVDLVGKRSLSRNRDDAVTPIFEGFTSATIFRFVTGTVRAVDDHGDFGETQRRVS